MKLNCAIIAALAAGISAPAIAGGYAEPIITPIAVPPAPEVRPHDWSGAYGGVFAGYMDGEFRRETDLLIDGPAPLEGEASSGIVGLRAGFNRQYGSLVTGADLSLSTGMSLDDTVEVSIDQFVDDELSLDALLTLRGRAGAAFGAEGRTLAYVAGGLAAGRLTDDDGGFGFGGSGSSDSDTAIGYTVGLGIERAIGARASIYGEVNHVDLGAVELNGVDTDMSATTALVGVNFKF